VIVAAAPGSKLGSMCWLSPRSEAPAFRRCGTRESGFVQFPVKHGNRKETLMALDLDRLGSEERGLAEHLNRSSWKDIDDGFREHNIDVITALYAPDAISIPADHKALRGHDEIRTWYAKRTNGFRLFIESQVDSVDIVGDLAIVVGVFRACRPVEEGVAGLDHGGRYLAVYRKIDGEWKMWRDMDTPSPDADIFYSRQPRGW
jgi:ketosteroid isomerase-like protein